jgi:hypothetical protein
LSHCKACQQYKNDPNCKYIDISEHVEDQNSFEFKAKLAVHKLGIKGFPAIVSDDLTKFLRYG